MIILSAVLGFLSLSGAIWLYGKSISPTKHAKNHRGLLNWKRCLELEGDIPEEEYKGRIEWIKNP